MHNFEATHDEMHKTQDDKLQKMKMHKLRANWFNLNDERESVALKLIARFQLINMKIHNPIKL
jgi:hypothetical protein